MTGLEFITLNLLLNTELHRKIEINFPGFIKKRIVSGFISIVISLASRLIFPINFVNFKLSRLKRVISSEMLKDKNTRTRIVTLKSYSRKYCGNEVIIDCLLNYFSRFISVYAVCTLIRQNEILAGLSERKTSVVFNIIH